MILSVAEAGGGCQSSFVKLSHTWWLAVSTALMLPLAAQAEKQEVKGEIPKDLIDDPHVREELAVNEFIGLNA